MSPSFSVLYKRHVTTWFEDKLKSGFLRVTESKHPAVTVLSQDKDYALNHVILLLIVLLNSPHPFPSSKMSSSVSEIVGAFLTLLFP